MIALTRTSVDIETEPQPKVLPALPEGFEIIENTLHYQGINLMALLTESISVRGVDEQAETPLYVRRLDSLRDNYHALQYWFWVAKEQLRYPGDLMIAYASKANPAQPVVRTLLEEGAAYECSSAYDVNIVRHAYEQGWLTQDRTILANGFKIPAYADNLVNLRRDGFEHLTPILDDLDEIDTFADSGLTFDVGLRYRTDMQEVNRFGMSVDDLECAVERIEAAGNLRLTILHAMQTVHADEGLRYQAALMRSVRAYARIKRIAPTLHRFNLGGGLPGRHSDMDFQDWMYQTLRNIMEVCEEEGIEPPDLMIESGRYLVQDHAMKMFSVLKGGKAASDGVPFYVIDGSIMSNFPDAWALGDEFTVLPINNWDSPFVEARLSGLTCDQDDIYPTRKMGDEPIWLPADTQNLIVGFFHCGAYQETLGGRGGSKHCLLPEGSELIIDSDTRTGEYVFTDYDAAQTAAAVLGNMGYH